MSIRASFFLFGSYINFPERIKSLFSYIPVAILPAILVPLVFYSKGSIEPLNGNERIIAFLISTGFCLYFKNTVVAIVTGMGALFILKFLF